ncbi:helix-turn-helix domain-containing protein [Campylobacter jejuni]|uniref:Cro/Cl family transcriptional regulator n=1 Tax=Campylobacter jejuni TaxID=197 RepID=A0A431GBB9_CAMJU|nr:helix-turn-helix domain-containing protein [Campylobacter jejuni]EAH9345490.1 Cro/Cl family transcriptional regulator [Campylobacter coli]EAH4555914.1 Cro/Cl family transcriptional regulator [Campylobacter jejuni]EAH5693007.1 Cro/Cl family transcriptional regulator [Campylobacter jejuni]EAH7323973.1 Cro/Cl family transcriptional regulator [Campylobacter jejuni]EAH8763224.1 Cro/Cl family transcriptional regulator [Campylobacter jejuni]
MNYEEIIKILKKIANVDTIKELSDVLNINYATFNTWATRGEIPFKRIKEFSEKLGVNIDTIINGNINTKGNENVIVQGKDNVVNFQKNSKYNDKFQEFLALYEKYGNEALLDQFINKLENLKKIIEE